jgi:excisionase family DNA binding protein
MLPSRAGFHGIVSQVNPQRKRDTTRYLFPIAETVQRGYTQEEAAKMHTTPTTLKQAKRRPRNKKRTRRHRFLTTGDVASYCEVTSAAVLKWIDAGKIPVFTTPGGHYRILRTDFRDFLAQHGMFIDEGFFGKAHTRKRILIVDDEPAVVAFIESALGLEGKYELAAASDGFEAGQQVASFEPDLIVLDIMLPGMDGFEVCSRVKADPTTAHVKILAVTGFATEENIKKILNQGADDYLEKPVTIQDLREKVQELLGGHD